MSADSRCWEDQADHRSAETRNGVVVGAIARGGKAIDTVVASVNYITKIVHGMVLSTSELCSHGGFID